MIEISHVSKVFPAGRGTTKVMALRDVNLSVDRGEVLGIIGPSGSGKSTLARCLTLLDRPTAGSIRVDGVDLTALTGDGLRQARRRVGVVFQQFNLLSSRTALGNVMLPLELAGVGSTERRARAQAALARVGLADKLSTHPAQLSGGQQQRVAIARAVVARPSLLVCDEATSALDPAATARVVELVRELTDELALTTVLITHEMAVARGVCDRVAVLSQGRIACLGGADDVLQGLAA